MATPRRRPRTYAESSAGALRDAFVTRRIDLGLTQEELADLAGVSRPTVQRFEAGVASATLATVDALAEALGVRVAVVDARGRPVVGHRV